MFDQNNKNQSLSVRYSGRLLLLIIIIIIIIIIADYVANANI